MIGNFNLEPAGGAVPLNSPFYLERPADSAFHEAIKRGDSVVLLKGARQMGKTSLLARGLHSARESGARIVLTDLQKINAAQLKSADEFLFTVADLICDQLDLRVPFESLWDRHADPNTNFERVWLRAVFPEIPGKIVWGLDEVDRLFAYPFSDDFFALLRSWQNARALEPAAPWKRLTLAIAYATEAHLFIRDLNQSPFNIGTRLTLEDFTFEQVAELNRRHGEPLKNPEELARFYILVGGHPFLVRRGLHELATQALSLEALERRADWDDGIFGDHLRRMVYLLRGDPPLLEELRLLLRRQIPPSPQSLRRLRNAGILVAQGESQARPRCRLYARYLSRALAAS